MAVTGKDTPTTLSLKIPKRRFGASLLRWEWMLVLLIILVILLNSRLSPYFLNATNLFRSSSDFMELGIMMLPMVFIIITGGIDLSVASTLGMTASFMGWLFIHGVNIWIGVAAALLLGMLAGLMNGILISRVKLPPLVVTLGSFAFYRGIAYVLLGDQAARDYPGSFTYLGQGQVFGTQVPFSMVLFIVLAVVFGLLLHKTAFGRYIFAIGHNEQACLYSGVPVARVKMIIYTLSGLMSALAGIILAARFASTRPDIGLGMELSVITTVFLGGISTTGGIGSMPGAVLSLLLIGLLRFGMGLVNIQGQTQSIAIGLLLVVSILVPNLVRDFSSRKLAINKQTVILILAGIFAFSLFWAFFLWSRSVVIPAL
jgi:rhamnose transport system permease protein